MNQVLMRLIETRRLRFYHVELLFSGSVKNITGQIVIKLIHKNITMARMKKLKSATVDLKAKKQEKIERKLEEKRTKKRK